MTDPKNKELRLYNIIMKKFTHEQFIEKAEQIHDLRHLHFVGWTECFPISMLPVLEKELSNGIN